MTMQEMMIANLDHDHEARDNSMCIGCDMQESGEQCAMGYCDDYMIVNNLIDEV